MAADHEHIEFDGHVVQTTDRAVLFHVDDADEDIWFPLSQVELSGDKGSILVPRWLPDKEGLG
jgi:hypothetical protein